MATCIKHVMLTAQTTCCECAHDYCDECLVYPFGPRKPPLCIACALTFAGVRTTKIVRRPKERKDSFAARRRRRLAPQIPEVFSPPPSLDVDRPVELQAWGR